MEIKEIDFENKENVHDILKIWDDNIGVLYPLDEKLLVQNYGSDKQRKRILGAYDGEELIGFVIYKQWTSISGVLKPNHEIGYINSVIVDIEHRNSGVGTALLDAAENDLLGRGVKLIHAGSDTNHFFPGIPYEFVNAQKLFSKRGYEMEETFYDLICDISKIEFEKLPSMNINSSQEYKVKMLEENEKEEFFSFFKKNFHGRWYQEMKDFFEIGMQNRDIVILKDNEKVIGFSHIYDNKSKFIGPSIYWRKLLLDNYGGLGPIGIDEDYRKKGLGLLILYRSLEILKKRNVKNMVIDWTDNDILNFYGMFNFLPWKEYRKATKRIK